MCVAAVAAENCCKLQSVMAKHGDDCWLDAPPGACRLPGASCEERHMAADCKGCLDGYTFNPATHACEGKPPTGPAAALSVLLLACSRRCNPPCQMPLSHDVWHTLAAVCA